MKAEKIRPFSFTVSSSKRSRNAETIAAGNGILAPGTVLGRITASGLLAPSPASGSDGSETAIAILGTYADTTVADANALVLARDAEVAADALIYDASVDDDTKIAAKAAQLAAMQIFIR